MQSHLSTNFPSVSKYAATLDAFRKAGFEIQITELDISGSNQESYCYNLMKSIIDQKNKGANISAIVWWGLSDDVSWRKNNKPLLFSRLGVKKGMYQKVLQAYYDSNIKQTFKPQQPSEPQQPSKPEQTPTTTGQVNPSVGETAKIADGWYYIKNANAGKYLQVAGNAAKAITNVCQWKANQQWIFESVSSEPKNSEPTEPINPQPSTPVSANLKLNYNINNWGSGYQVNFKVSNDTLADVSGWTLKIKKSDINIGSSWNVTVNEVGDYYVITPLSYNSNIAKGRSVEFGIQGSGRIGNTINYTLS